MANIALKRVITDIKEYLQEKPENTFIYYNEVNLFIIYLLIIGLENTPYEDGFYFFKVVFTDDYPYKPPNVTFLTTTPYTRFNPNLYENGKVCLSILGTWDGPQWSSILTLRSLVLTLQSIFTENPLKNEIYYYNENTSSEKNINYNKIIQYYNWSVAIIEMLKKPVVSEMTDIILNYFITNKQKYITKLTSLQQLQPKEIYSVYNMREYIDYKSLQLIK